MFNTYVLSPLFLSHLKPILHYALELRFVKFCEQKREKKRNRLVFLPNAWCNTKKNLSRWANVFFIFSRFPNVFDANILVSKP